MRTFQGKRFQFILLCTLNLAVLAVPHGGTWHWQNTDDFSASFSDLGLTDRSSEPEHESSQRWQGTSYFPWNRPLPQHHHNHDMTIVVPVEELRANHPRLESANARDNTPLSTQHSALTAPVRLNDGRLVLLIHTLHRNRELHYTPEVLEQAATFLGPPPAQNPGERLRDYFARHREYYDRLNDFAMDQVSAGLDQAAVRSETTEPSGTH